MVKDAKPHKSDSKKKKEKQAALMKQTDNAVKPSSKKISAKTKSSGDKDGESIDAKPLSKEMKALKKISSPDAKAKPKASNNKKPSSTKGAHAVAVEKKKPSQKKQKKSKGSKSGKDKIVKKSDKMKKKVSGKQASTGSKHQKKKQSKKHPKGSKSICFANIMITA
ncbi:hypothetical protein D917_07748, partial [Trichinella nativa]